jgi:hypothetical protein
MREAALSQRVAACAVFLVADFPARVPLIEDAAGRAGPVIR